MKLEIILPRGEPSPRYSWYRLTDAAQQSLPKGGKNTLKGKQLYVIRLGIVWSRKKSNSPRFHITSSAANKYCGVIVTNTLFFLNKYLWSNKIYSDINHRGRKPGRGKSLHWHWAMEQFSCDIHHVTLLLSPRILIFAFLGPRGPLVEPSIFPSRPVHPSATIFPEFIDEL